MFGPEGKWLIEGHEIKAHPVPQMTAPKYPDKSVHYPGTSTGAAGGNQQKN